MKKAVSLLLILVLLLSVCVITSSAETDIQEFVCKDKFIEQHIKNYMWDLRYYEEEYIHLNTEGNIDWVFVHAESTDRRWSVDKGVALAGEKIVFANCVYYPFLTGRAIYDVNEDKFYDLLDVLFESPSKYEGLIEYIETSDLGYPLGDADLDNKLSILDATYIQRALAKLCDFDEIDDISLFSTDDQKYISDINRDGKRTILDATAIQFKLAKLDIPVATPDEA